VVEQLVVDCAVGRLLAVDDTREVAVADPDIGRGRTRSARRTLAVMAGGPDGENEEENAGERQVRELTEQRRIPRDWDNEKPGRRCRAGPVDAST
jgi:hypothetical protein